MLIFPGYYYYGFDYIYFTDNEMNNFKLEQNIIQTRSLFYYSEDFYKNDLTTYVSNGYHDEHSTLAYYVLSNIWWWSWWINYRKEFLILIGKPILEIVMRH